MEKRKNFCWFLSKRPHIFISHLSSANYVAVPTYSLLFITMRMGEWLRSVSPPICEYGKSFFSLNVQKAGPCRTAQHSTGMLIGCICLPETSLLKHHQIMTMSNHVNIPLILLPNLAKTRWWLKLTDCSPKQQHGKQVCYLQYKLTRQALTIDTCPSSPPSLFSLCK